MGSTVPEDLLTWVFLSVLMFSRIYSNGKYLQKYIVGMSQAFFVILCPSIVTVINENNRENIEFLPFYLSYSKSAC